MARRAELFVRELSDEEAAHLLKLARRSRNAVVQLLAAALFGDDPAGLRGDATAAFGGNAAARG
jgi:hypothetical protein